MPINPMIAAAGAGGIIGAVSDAISSGRNRKDAETQFERQKELMDKQQAQQLEMWKRTNYSEQVNQMQKAGLNPALLYGTSGGGATTTGSSSGSAAMAAPATNSIAGGVGMGIELGLMKAQKENIEADTKVKEAEATKTAGVDTQEASTRISSLIAGIGNTQAQEQLTKVQTRIAEIDERVKGMTVEATADYIENTARKAYEELIHIAIDNQISRATVNEKLNIIQQESIAAGLRNTLTKSGIEVNKAQIEKWSQEIQQGWNNLGRQDKELKIKGIMAEVEQYNKGMSNAGMTIRMHNAETIATQIDKILSIGKKDY